MSESTDYVDLLWASKALLIRDQPFILKSGRESYVYANHRNLICLPQYLEMFSELLVSTARSRYERTFAFSNVDSSVSPYLVSGCSLIAKFPFYSLRPVSREKGLADQVFSYARNEGSTFEPRLPAVVVDDVVTTTSTLLHAVQTLGEESIAVLGAVCLLDRRVASERESGDLTIAAVATLPDVLNHALAHVDLDGTQRRLVEIELLALEN